MSRYCPNLAPCNVYIRPRNGQYWPLIRNTPPIKGFRLSPKLIIGSSLFSQISRFFLIRQFHFHGYLRAKHWCFASKRERERGRDKYIPHRDIRSCCRNPARIWIRSKTSEKLDEFSCRCLFRLVIVLEHLLEDWIFSSKIHRTECVC